MAYIGNTARLCQDIVDGELEHVEDWLVISISRPSGRAVCCASKFILAADTLRRLSTEGADPNTRDYTGRTPLHLAVMTSTPGIVKCLVEHGARLVARLADGRTALHLAAMRGDTEIVKILMDKSNANEAEEEEKQAQKRTAKSAQAEMLASHEQDSRDENNSVFDIVRNNESDEEDQGSLASGSFVKVKKEDEKASHEDAVPEEDEDSPDFYDVNVVAWDTPCSALHFAIICGHEEVVKLLCQEYGADILLPVKFHDDDKKPTAAILTLVLSAKLPIENAKSMAGLILSLGATCAQADLNGFTAFYRLVDASATELIEALLSLDKIGVKNSMNHITWVGWNEMYWPLQKAIQNGDVKLILQLLDAGAIPHIDYETWLKSAKQTVTSQRLQATLEENIKVFNVEVEQPIVMAARSSNPSVVLELLKRGVDVNTMTALSHHIINNAHFGGGVDGSTALDIVREQIKRLREYKPPAATPPQLKHGMDDFLDKYKVGTWQHASVRIAVLETKKSNEAKVETYEKEKARIAALPGLHEKQADIESTIASLEEVERVIIASGGKSFRELYPDIKKPGHYHQNLWKPPKFSPEFTYSFSFIPAFDVTEKRREKYIEL